MKLSQVLVLSAAQFITGALAQPVEDVQPRATNAGIFISTGPDWSGQISYLRIPYNQCYSLPEPWFFNISSIRPDSGTAVSVSKRNYCNNISYAVYYPGQDNLNAVGWNDQIASLIAHPVEVEGGRNCIKRVFPGTTCSQCCNGCAENGTDCEPDE